MIVRPHNLVTLDLSDGPNVAEVLRWCREHLAEGSYIVRHDGGSCDKLLFFTAVDAALIHFKLRWMGQ